MVHIVNNRLSIDSSNDLPASVHPLYGARRWFSHVDDDKQRASVASLV